MFFSETPEQIDYFLPWLLFLQRGDHILIKIWNGLICQECLGVRDPSSLSPQQTDLKQDTSALGTCANRRFRLASEKDVQWIQKTNAGQMEDTSQVNLQKPSKTHTSQINPQKPLPSFASLEAVVAFPCPVTVFGAWLPPLRCRPGDEPTHGTACSHNSAFTAQCFP